MMQHWTWVGRRWLQAATLSGLIILVLGGCRSSSPAASKTAAAPTSIPAARQSGGVSSAAASASGSTTSAATGSGAAANTSSANQPNVLFILTDDMRFDDMQFLPQTKQLIGDAGMTFDNEFDNVTLCCPARTSILRGQYSHNTGVLTNDASNGGFESAYSKKDEASTVATAMHEAGYRTGLFGKYLNGYPNTASTSYIPPGWDAWASSTKGNAYSEFNYTLNQNGKQVPYGKKPADYGTDVYTGMAKDMINQAAKSSQPFFIYLAVYAPHQPATPAPQDENAFPGLQAPRDAAYNEADVSDKPQYIRQLPSLTPREQKNLDNLYRKRAQSLQDVDRSVAALVDLLHQNGQLDNTYIVFTSDNGFHLGQHRMLAGKQTAFETDIHLPLLVRGPGITAGSHVSAITGNIDLAPTMADMAGSTMSDNPDGRSLLPFLQGKTSANWRQAYLLEHWTATTAASKQSSNGPQLEPDDPDQGGVTPGDDTSQKRAATDLITKIPEYQGLRVAGYTYVEYSTGERELYDLARDPEELTNLASTAPAALLATLHQRLDDLRHCSGATCRSSEDAALDLR